MLCLALSGAHAGLVLVGRPGADGRPVLETHDLSAEALGDTAARLARLYRGLPLAWGYRSTTDREQLAELLGPSCLIPPLPRPLRLGPLVPSPGASDAYQLAWRLAASLPLAARWRPAPCPTTSRLSRLPSSSASSA